MDFKYGWLPDVPAMKQFLQRYDTGDPLKDWYTQEDLMGWLAGFIELYLEENV